MLRTETRSIQIERVTAATEEVRALVGELDWELSQHYVAAQRHGLAVEEIFQPHVPFFVARIDGAAVGCGGVALFDSFAEVKRMYVRREHRGRRASAVSSTLRLRPEGSSAERRERGVADAILAVLEAQARDAGLKVLRLETGTHQIAAIRFYRRCGFEPCAAFEPYASMPAHAIATSVFMEKEISEK